MARKSLKAILSMEDSKKKEYELLMFIFRSMPQSVNWNNAKKEYDRLRGWNQ